MLHRARLRRHDRRGDPPALGRERRLDLPPLRRQGGDRRRAVRRGPARLSGGVRASTRDRRRMPRQAFARSCATTSVGSSATRTGALLDEPARDGAARRDQGPRARAQSRVLPAVTAWVERRSRRARCDRCPPTCAEPVLLGPCQEFSRLWLAGRTRVSLRRAERELADATWNAVREAVTGGHRSASEVSLGVDGPPGNRTRISEL